jgi:hypothetical protein
MTPEQIQQYRDALRAGKVADDKVSEARIFLHGWNEGVMFAEMLLAKIVGKEGEAS